MEFEDLSFPEAPKIVGKLPGKAAIEILNQQQLLEGGAVSYPRSIPLVMDKGRGATILDPDGNIFLDFFSGAGVLALGHCNTKKEIYDIPKGGCVNTSCGEVCYLGADQGNIFTRINGEFAEFPAEYRKISVEECELPVVSINNELLVLKNWFE